MKHALDLWSLLQEEWYWACHHGDHDATLASDLSGDRDEEVSL